jgi:hypothetical protein
MFAEFIIINILFTFILTNHLLTQLYYHSMTEQQGINYTKFKTIKTQKCGCPSGH